MSVFGGEESIIKEAYEDVRSDESETAWCVLRYDGKKLTEVESGVEYCDFLALCGGELQLVWLPEPATELVSSLCVCIYSPQTTTGRTATRGSRRETR
jgi:hypothetical protein